MHKHITDKQMRVATLIGEGLSYTEVGKKLELSHRTIERHVKSVSDRIGDDEPLNITPYRRVQRWILRQTYKSA